MHQLSKSSLSSIVGGFSRRDWQPNVNSAMSSTVTVATSKSAVKTNTQLIQAANVNVFAGLQNEADNACICSAYTWTAPKNGDRNSLGQIYSWGTWWDDTH